VTDGVAAGAAGRAPRRYPVGLTLAATLVVALASLPLAYLVVRAAGGGDAWAVLVRGTTGELLLNTLALVAAVTAASATIGVGIAWLVVRTDLPCRRVLGVLAALPLVIPSYVAALALLGAFGPRGLLQQLLAGPFGVERIPDVTGFPGAFAALTLSTYPYVYLLVAAGLRSLDPALEEAARGLGRTQTETFFRVTLPALRPSIAVGSLLVALYTLADFGAVSLMQYDALTRAIYLQYRALFDRTPAAVLALVLVALTAVLLWLEARTRRGSRWHRVGPGSGRPPRRIPLGRWRWPAFAAVCLAVGVFLVVPLTILGYWLERALSLGDEIGLAWQPALNSVGVSLAAAAAAVAASLTVALLARKRPGRLAVLLERLGYLPNALPGVVIALSLVFFGARYASPVYQTLGLLLFAYVVRFLPQALAGSTSALAGVSPRLEEAARGLGRRPLRTFLEVTLPLARPGLAAGAVLVFLSTMKELPATLLLRPIGFESLATEVWKFTSVGSYSQAALPALLLLAVATPFVVLLAGRYGAAATRSDPSVPSSS
jgi:iron(III) transport system permease protein